MALAFWTFVALVTVAPVAAGLAPVLGGRVSDRGLHTSLGVAAGLMLGVAFLRVLPRTFALGGPGVAATLGVAFVALYVVESQGRVHGHTAHEGSDHEPGDHFAGLLAAPASALVVLALHMVVDGLVLPAAFEAGQGVGTATGLAIAAHKVPAGLAVGTLLAGAGYRGSSGVLGLAAVAAATPVGVALGVFMVDVGGFVPHLLAVAAATLLFVAVAEILPEVHHGPHTGRVTGALVLGFAVFFALDVFVLPG